jgi:ribonuclease J
MTPDENDFWFLPLGGTGEIGMNMNLYGHDGQWLMVDCGVTFDKEMAPTATGERSHIQMADPQFIASRKQLLAGLVITHAHEDHIGAVPYLWKQLRCPIYTTKFTAEILRRKLVEVGLDHKVPVHIVEKGGIRTIGPFEVEWIGLTHSIPDPYALLISTPVGKVFHTADWKLDASPVVGERFDPAWYQDLALRGIDAMVCDSTNATVSGHSATEASLYKGLKQHIEAAPARVIVACFGSNIARLHTLARIAEETGRHIGLLGRSLINMMSAARAADVWQYGKTLVEPAHLSYLPRESVLLVATGSQGEPRTALNRLSNHSFRDLALEPGDTVIFSSKMIPGNEDAIESMIKRLKVLQVTVITADESEVPIHASGHPAADELALMYGWVQPDCTIPVHGEAVHLKTNGEIAKSVGVPKQLIGENGDLYMIAPIKGIRRQRVETGRLGLDDKRKLFKLET